MTNQNPAASQSQSPPGGNASSQQNRDLLAKVNAHADRSMDRLFADIEELLGEDLASDPHSSSVDSARTPYSTDRSRTAEYSHSQQPPIYPPQRSLSAGEAPPVEQPTPATSKPNRSMPLWLKALLGIGITSIAAGSILTWLVNERKIVLPQNIDTSWLPFQSQISPADAKFADYMQKSIAKIDATTQTTSATNLPTPATSIVTPATSPAAPIAVNPGTIVTAATAPAPTAVLPKISLLKTIQSGKRPSAIFEIDRQSKTIDVGQTIGTSNWSLLTVAKGEVIIKRKGGEIRSVYVGQKF
jgi:hypothetical protein